MLMHINIPWIAKNNFGHSGLKHPFQGIQLEMFALEIKMPLHCGWRRPFNLNFRRPLIGTSIGMNQSFLKDTNEIFVVICVTTVNLAIQCVTFLERTILVEL